MSKKPLFILISVLAIGFGLAACTRSGSESEMNEKSKISHYTCPMHPQVHEDHPGDCPICHMKLVPVYKEGSTQREAPAGGPSVQISPERQQLIGIKIAAAVKKQVAQEIRTVGRVAFDPELAVAQREFLEIAKSVPSLKKASVSRLRLLGMGSEEIRSLEKNGKTTSSLYLPEAGDASWIYATLYQSEMGVVSTGTRAVITLPSASDETFEGVVRSIDPVIDPMTRSARARIEVSDGKNRLRPDAYVNVLLKIDLGEALTIPKSALINTGTRKIAFVVHEGQRFQSRDIKTGPEVGEDIVILEGITEGEKVVSSAAFLVDSESQLKAAVTVAPSMPSCPEGQAWDTGMSMCMPKVGS